MGLCYAGLGLRQECVQAFERARGLAPNDPDVLFNLGLAYEDVARRPGWPPPRRPCRIGDAAALYRRVLELAPSYQAAKDRLKEIGD